MKIIITGATSFVGRAAANCLKARGHELTAFRHSFDEEPEKVPVQADVWLHFAWAGVGSAGRSDPKIQDYNVNMTLAAIEKARELGCRRFLFSGSQAEYGHAQDGGMKSEYGAAEPVSEYGKAKLRVLNSVPKMDMEYIHMRIFSVYGPGDHAGSLVNTLIRGFGAGETVSLGPCAQQWNFMYIDDTAEAIALLCEQGESGIYNVAGEETMKLSAYVERVRDIMGGGTAAFGSRADNAEGPADLSPDVHRLQALGFKCRISFEEGIRRTAGELK